MALSRSPSTLTSRPAGPWLILAVVSLAQLLGSLDTTVINIALPAMRAGLDMSPESPQWMISSYMLAFGGLLPLAGRLADRLGSRTLVIWGSFAFAVVSLAGGFASDTSLLIVVRVAQGACAAALAPSTLSVLTATFTEERKRVQAMSIFTAVMMAGAAVGLLLGGVLTEFAGWRSCFFVFLPMGLLAAGGAAVLLPRGYSGRPVKLDFTSTALSTLGVAAVLYALSGAGSQGWHAPAVIGSFAGGIALVAAFLRRQSRLREPLMPLPVLRARPQRTAALCAASTSFSTYGIYLVLTFYLQEIKHIGVLLTGVAFLPLFAAHVVVSTQLAPRLLRVLPPRVPLLSGLALIVAGTLILAQLSPGPSAWAIVLTAEIVVGVGTGLDTPAMLATATTGVAADDTGPAWAYLFSAHLLGAAVGVAFMSTVAVTVSEADRTADPATATVLGYSTGLLWTAVTVTGALLVIWFSSRRRGGKRFP